VAFGAAWNYNFATVKIEKSLARMAKAISTRRGVSVGDYLSDLSQTAIARGYAKVLRELKETDV
jgi:hypothetical protein